VQEVRLCPTCDSEEMLLYQDLHDCLFGAPNEFMFLGRIIHNGRLAKLAILGLNNVIFGGTYSVFISWIKYLDKYDTKLVENKFPLPRDI